MSSQGRLEWLARQGVSTASVVTSLGWYLAIKSTQLGFNVARGATKTAFVIGGVFIDTALPSNGTGVASGMAMAYLLTSGINLVEMVTMVPMRIGQSITSTSLVAASGSIDVLSSIFGTHEASFSLGEFVTLVRREWSSPMMADQLPEDKEKYSVLAVARALVAWAALQRSTSDHHVAKWLDAVEPIAVEAWLTPGPEPTRAPAPSTTSRDSRLFVMEDVFLPEHGGQLITADIGEKLLFPPSVDYGREETFPARNFGDIRLTLRRLSKLCLGGYGGAGLLFFGVPLPPSKCDDRNEEQAKGEEEETIARLVLDAEAQEVDDAAKLRNAALSPGRKWWDIIMGKHDQEIIEHFATLDQPTAKITATIGEHETIPRFWVLVDHSRREVILIMRGTYSLNDLAVDLTCESVEFEPMTKAQKRRSTLDGRSPYLVHEGMWRMAQVMGSAGKPVHGAVAAALRRNRGYELLLCGHSLGAGIAGLLALMWADPATCLTIPSSGLPVGRRVSAYCIAPPCLTSAALSELSNKLITSFVYSYDVVSRLSLGSIRDLTRACWWLCDGKDDENPNHIIRKALGIQGGLALLKGRHRTADDATFLLSLRKTLEANMHFAELYPPGAVLWATALPQPLEDVGTIPELNLYEVKKVEAVFNQVTFAQDMLSAHMPHTYDRVLHELL